MAQSPKPFRPSPPNPQQNLPQYCVLSGPIVVELNDVITRKMDEGWKCQGGIHYTPSTNGAPAVWAQAMVK